MINVKETEIMYNFLVRNYPTIRAKHGTKFKRTIFLDRGQKYAISDKNTFTNLYRDLTVILELVFNAGNDVNRIVLKAFLNL